jgi:hypothetical protein
MKVQIINFGIEDLTEDQFSALCDELAPAFAAVPGLLSKVWLRNGGAGAYGGVYLWRSEEDLEAFRAGELYRGVGEHPNLVDITDRDYDVFEAPTAVTRGLPALTAGPEPAR